MANPRRRNPVRTGARFACTVAVMLPFCACGPRIQSPQPREFKLGFWYWKMRSAYTYQGPPVEALYVHGGELDEKGRLDNVWPKALPPARLYVGVLRVQKPAIPKETTLPLIVEAYRSWATSLREQGLVLRGLQIDLDAPSSRLGEYATFLGSLRKALPPGTRLSITALLDWFRTGTRVEKVIDRVDEFVPQFYDVHPPADLPRIAETVSDRLADRFEDLGKPYWAGVASFGRIERIRGSPPQRRAYRELSPLELLSAPVRRTGVFTSPAGERILHFTSRNATPRLDLLPDDAVDMILPTRESIQRAVSAARGFGPTCQGVLFFRWPEKKEVLALTPGEVLAAAKERAPRVAYELSSEDGGCVERRCYDLAVKLGDRLSASPASLRITTSSPLDYFSQATRLEVVFESRTAVRVEIPGDSREPILPIGRAFAREPVTFTLAVRTP